jgi:hypothetical protein
MLQLILFFIALGLVLGVLYIIGLLIFHAAPYLLAAAALYGAGIALRNYGLAFITHVKPQRSTP